MLQYILDVSATVWAYKNRSNTFIIHDSTLFTPKWTKTFILTYHDDGSQKYVERSTNTFSVEYTTFKLHKRLANGAN